MGYNTVAFLLNDLMDTLRKSPNAVVYGLSCPPHTNREEDRARWQAMINRVADEHGEPHIHGQALEVLGTFHADETKFFMAGGNCIHEFDYKDVTIKKIKGEKYALLKLPQWKQ